LHKSNLSTLLLRTKQIAFQKIGQHSCKQNGSCVKFPMLNYTTARQQTLQDV